MRPRRAAFDGLPLAPGLRVGLFGGSFDPPHDGHLHVARTARIRGRLDRVVWLVSPGNPLKARAPGDLQRRIAAARRMAVGGGMIVSDAEARLGSRYTVDTVRALKARHPGVRFVWVMGADNLAQFHRWKAWAELFREFPILVVARPGQALRGRLSLAARRFAHARLPGAQAALLAGRTPPAWAYVAARWNFASSTALRSRLRAPGD